MFEVVVVVMVVVVAVPHMQKSVINSCFPLEQPCPEMTDSKLLGEDDEEVEGEGEGGGGIERESCCCRRCCPTRLYRSIIDDA